MTTLKKDPSPGGPTTDGSTIFTDQHNAIVDRLGGEAAPTGSRVVVTAGDGDLTTSSVTTTTLGYLDATSSLQTQIDEKAATSHTHTESDISDLQAYLLNISGEPLSDLSDVTITSIATGEILKWNGSAWINNTLAEAGISATGHNHTESDITDLQSYALETRKLDDFGTPDDNTDLDATTSRHGLLPKLGGGTTNFLRADGTWAAPAGGSGGDFTDLVPCTLEIPEGTDAYPDIHALATASAKVSGFVMPNAVDSTINFKCVVPDDLAASPAAKFRVRVMTLGTQTDKDIVLLSQHVSVADGENLDQSLSNTTSGGDSGALRMPNSIENLDYYTATFQTQPVAGDTIIGQLTREASSDANDDYLDDVMIIGIDMIIERSAS